MNQVPHSIGLYTIESLIGSSPGGKIYRAAHSRTGQKVVIVTIAPRPGLNADSIKNDLTVLRSITHPGCVPVFDQGIHQQSVWYALALVEGVTLKHYFEGPVRPGERLRWDHGPVDAVRPSSSSESGAVWQTHSVIEGPDLVLPLRPASQPADRATALPGSQ